MIETIKLSARAKVQLSNLKKRTGLQNWNVLCRWAFCISLSEPSKPPHEVVPADSSVEMTWRTFTGRDDDTYWALLIARAQQDDVDLSPASLNAYFRLHLHRGISFLNNRIDSKEKNDGIRELIELAMGAKRARVGS